MHSQASCSIALLHTVHVNAVSRWESSDFEGFQQMEALKVTETHIFRWYSCNVYGDIAMDGRKTGTAPPNTEEAYIL